MNPRVLGTIVVAIALTAAACSSPSSSSEDPAAVLAAYEDARNADDVDALIALYADDAVVIGHPLDGDGIAEGVTEIRTLESRGPAIRGENGFTQYSAIEVSGNTVTFNQKFVTGVGSCFSDSGNEITVVDDKITLYEWGDDEDDQCG